MPNWSLWNFNNTIALYASWNFAHGTICMICWKERIKKGSICKIEEGPMLILSRDKSRIKGIYFLLGFSKTKIMIRKKFITVHWSTNSYAFMQGRCYSLFRCSNEPLTSKKKIIIIIIIIIYIKDFFLLV